MKIQNIFSLNGKHMSSRKIYMLVIFLYLLSLAYQFVQENNKSYLKAWDIYKQADEEWLIDFEMAHSKELSRIFPYDGVYKESKREEEFPLFNEMFPRYVAK